ncbi:MAG: hypothetical protein ACRER1_06090 [Gammaproteobacteria bacterium]
MGVTALAATGALAGAGGGVGGGVLAQAPSVSATMAIELDRYKRNACM